MNEFAARINVTIPLTLKFQVDTERMRNPDFNLSSLITDFLNNYFSEDVKKLVNKNKEQILKDIVKNKVLAKKVDNKLFSLNVSLIKFEEEERINFIRERKEKEIKNNQFDALMKDNPELWGLDE